VSDETPLAEMRRFYVNLLVPVFNLHDWRDLAGRTLKDSDDEKLVCGGPDLYAHPPGQDPKVRADGWATELVFGERDEHEFEFELRAYRPSERSRAANRELHLKQIMGEQLPPDWEGRDWLNEGDSLSFSGRVRLAEFLCLVPINTAQPIECAKQMTRRELDFHEFGFCRVNGGDHFNGAFKPDDGVHNEGRLVVLNVATDFFYQWQRRHQKPPES
jgi:hypothetical protein